MKKYQKKILLTITFSILLVAPLFAVKAINKPKLQVTIPTISLSNDSSFWIGQYILGIYKYGIGIVGILAAVVLMYGGIRWLTSGGSSEKIGDAKAWIGAALSGLVLALASFLILTTINPELVKIQSINPKDVSQPATSSKEMMSNFIFDPDCAGSTFGVVNANDPSARSKCEGWCSDLGVSMSYVESNYFQKGLAYCCVCGVCNLDGSNNGTECASGKTCQNGACL